jgi:hypothetical protein
LSPAAVRHQTVPLLGRQDAPIVASGKRANHKDWNLRLKVAQIVIAATIPVVAAWARAPGSPALWAHRSWCSTASSSGSSWRRTGCYGATAEALKHKKFLYLAQAGPYSDATAGDAVLSRTGGGARVAGALVVVGGAGRGRHRRSALIRPGTSPAQPAW